MPELRTNLARINISFFANPRSTVGTARIVHGFSWPFFLSSAHLARANWYSEASSVSKDSCGEQKHVDTLSI